MLELRHRDHAIRITRMPQAGGLVLAIEVQFSHRATLTSYRRISDADDAEQAAVHDAIALVNRVIDAPAGVQA